MEEVFEITIKHGDSLQLNNMEYFIKLVEPHSPLFKNQEIVLTLEFKDLEIDYNFIIR
jgi:copper(I)-binding protein